MRKWERENPCGICGHYHRYEEGEPCGVCGHRLALTPAALTPKDSAFPSEILTEFLFLGSYDNASRAELLKTIGVSHLLNVRTPPSISFTAQFKMLNELLLPISHLRAYYKWKVDPRGVNHF